MMYLLFWTHEFYMQDQKIRTTYKKQSNFDFKYSRVVGL